jgi:hypothetical protein
MIGNRNVTQSIKVHLEKFLWPFAMEMQLALKSFALSILHKEIKAMGVTKQWE